MAGGELSGKRLTGSFNCTWESALTGEVHPPTGSKAGRTPGCGAGRLSAESTGTESGRRRAGLRVRQDVQEKRDRCARRAEMKVKDGGPKWGQRLVMGRSLHGDKEATEGPGESSGLGMKIRLLSRGWLLKEERAGGLEPLRGPGWCPELTSGLIPATRKEKAKCQRDRKQTPLANGCGGLSTHCSADTPRTLPTGPHRTLPGPRWGWGWGWAPPPDALPQGLSNLQGSPGPVR